jgi:outer membrane biosynthesis protein TonB
MANFPDLNDDGKVTRADVLKGRGVFKRGGKVKKMRKFEEGGDVEFESKMGQNPQIDEMTRIRAQDYAEEMQRPAPEIETREAPKAKPKAKPKAEPKAEPKTTPKVESKKEEPSFLKGTKGYKNLGALFKSMREKAGITSYKSGGKVSSASKRADGIALRGKTRI